MKLKFNLKDLIITIVVVIIGYFFVHYYYSTIKVEHDRFGIYLETQERLEGYLEVFDAISCLFILIVVLLYISAKPNDENLDDILDNLN